MRIGASRPRAARSTRPAPKIRRMPLRPAMPKEAHQRADGQDPVGGEGGQHPAGQRDGQREKGQQGRAPSAERHVQQQDDQRQRDDTGGEQPRPRRLLLLVLAEQLNVVAAGKSCSAGSRLRRGAQPSAAAGLLLVVVPQRARRARRRGPPRRGRAGAVGFPVLAQPTALRLVLVIAASAALTVGTLTHRQAAFVLGAGTLLVVVIERLSPCAPLLPRWVAVATQVPAAARGGCHLRAASAAGPRGRGLGRPDALGARRRLMSGRSLVPEQFARLEPVDQAGRGKGRD